MNAINLVLPESAKMPIFYVSVILSISFLKFDLHIKLFRDIMLYLDCVETFLMVTDFAYLHIFDESSVFVKLLSKSGRYKIVLN